ncbi:MAG: hypothetical protein V7L01_00275 [Nostoc sp.]
MLILKIELSDYSNPNKSVVALGDRRRHQVARHLAETMGAIAPRDSQGKVYVVQARKLQIY